MSKEVTIEPTNISSLLRNQDQSVLQEVHKFQSSLASNRKKFLKKLNNYIAEIQDKLTSLKSEIHGDYSMELRDADYYRVNMFQLEGKITQLKQSISIELCNLLREEADLSRDIQFMERRVEEWTKQPIVTLRPVKSAAPNIRTTSLGENDTMSEFQKFLTSSGGHTGKWDEQDHLLFLRERKKYGGKPKFISAVHCLLPDIDEEEIQAHDNWYQQYEKLKREQKEAIKKWREARQSSMEKRQETSGEEREDSAQKVRPKSYAAQRDITERIKEWKRQQIVKKAEEEERQREDQLRQREERERKREIQKARKSAVNAYKADKLSRMQAEMLRNQMKELQALEDRAKKNVLLKAFRDQDQQIIEKRRMQRFRGELREKQREERLRNVKSSVNLSSCDRDPQRILQATLTWQQHVNTTQMVEKPMPLALHNIPHLAVPSWRKGLYSTQTL